MRPSAPPPPSDTPDRSDLETVMRAGDRVPMPPSFPGFRLPIAVAVSAVAIWAGIALFWPVPKHVALHLCGHGVQTESCVIHH